MPSLITCHGCHSATRQLDAARLMTGPQRWRRASRVTAVTKRLTSEVSRHTLFDFVGCRERPGVDCASRLGGNFSILILVPRLWRSAADRTSPACMHRHIHSCQAHSTM
ncbi:hypothetical protein K466DRAFT_27496 [Polyporus arcularius HHB13444]|uniref:Uncharacterized protein n=1 Tax=Polyporus arcularius HHB13444 TaxID=1314778 RepID=A0A5C3PJM7_9APHY|nr:hypothetical protein K466DRAFT_27496 [Polyporus arcularius HHB13444]